MTPENIDDVDPLQYLNDADRNDFELMEKGSSLVMTQALTKSDK